MMGKLLNKFRYAFQGLVNGLREDHSIRLQFVCALLAVGVGLVMHFSYLEMAVVLAMCGLVIGLEYLNSALENLLNYHLPETNAEVGKIKDLAAGGVLVASIMALIIGLLFVLKHLGGL